MASYPRSSRPYPAIAERGRPSSSNAEARDADIAEASAPMGRIAGNMGRTAEPYARDVARDDDAGAGRAYAGGDGGTGGKIRSSRKSAIASNRKRTPYERPPAGPHAARGGSAASPASSITSRIVDSASRLISSSASYLFSSLFKRQPPAIANGDGLPALESTVDEEEVGVQGGPIPSQTENHDNPLSQAEPPTANGTNIGMETHLAQVEQILKQQIWSREQVNRLTEILKTQVQENNGVSSNTGSQRQDEQPRKLQNDVIPIQVARAYMESRPSAVAVTGSFHGISNLPDKVSELQLLPVRGLSDDRYRGPYTRTLVMSPVASRKRSVLDADLGVVRRVRQKTMLQASPSPYARSRPLMSPPIRSTETATRILETLEKLSPSPKGKLPEGQVKVTTKHPEQAPETSKVREKSSLTVEGVSSSQKEAGPSSGRKSFCTPLPTVNVVTDVLSTTEPPWSPAIIPEKTLSSGSPVIVSERTKGFRMSAMFEETNSDEENRLNALERNAHHPSGVSTGEPAQQSFTKPSLEPLVTNASTSTELGDGSVSTVKFTSTKEVSDGTPLASVSSELPAHTSTAIDLPVSAPVVASSAMDALSPAPVSSPSFSFPLYSTEPKPSFLSAQSTVDTSVSMAKEAPIFRRATAAASPVVGADSSMSSLKLPVPDKIAPPSSSAWGSTASSTPSQASLLISSMGSTASEAAPIPELASSSPSSSSLLSSSLVITSSSATAAAPALATGLSAISSAAPATLSTPEAMPASPLTTAVTPVNVTAAPSLGVVPVTPPVVDVLPEGDNGAIMATEALGTEKPPEVETMSPDPMSEEPDASTMLPPVTTFQFDSSPASSSSLGTTFAFRSGGPATPSSAFSFATGASTSSSTSFLFGNQLSSSSSTGQLFNFGASSTSSLANPFGAPSTSSSVNPFSASNIAPAFSFGSSSTGTTASPTFGITSSAFSATVSTPSTFSFGGTSSSTSMSSASSSGQIFGFGGQGQLAPSAGPFGSSGSSSSAFTFTSSPANASMGTPTFAFGSGASSSLSSSSSFTGQPFAFNGQPNSPFSSSGAPSSTPAFSFGSSSLASGSTSAPAFAFGAQGASSAGQPFGGSQAFGQMGPSQPFGAPTFGSSSSAGQPYGGGSMLGAPAAAQPFAFGGQPSLPAQSPQSPFPPGGAPTNAFSQGPFEFPAGGFALGATGGEKSGRKYIKAKRGGAKRGK